MAMKTWAVTAAMAMGLLLSMPAHAQQTVGGVKFADQVEVGGESLKLNGAGLRTRFMLKVYAIGLYLPSPAKDQAAVLSQDGAKQIRMHMLRNVGRDSMGDAIREGFERNSSANLPALKERLDKLLAALPDLKKDDVITITIVPGKGTHVRAPNGDVLQLPGKDFSDALLGVWLGARPADADVKRALLQGGGGA